MKNVSDMKMFLLKQMEDLNDGKLSAVDALASAALASKVLSCEKMILEIPKLVSSTNIIYDSPPESSYEQATQDDQSETIKTEWEILDRVRF